MIERLTASETGFLWQDDRGWPQEIAALAILDGQDLVDDDGEVRLGTVRDHVAARLGLIPRFRQRLVRAPRGLGWPYWVDDPTFDIAFHVNVTRVEAPGNEAQVLRACEGLRRVAFDPTRPRWSMWFLTGLPEGRVGWYVRVHHSIADGVAGVALLATFLDGEPAAAEQPGPWHARSLPTVRQLLADNVRRRCREARRGIAALSHPITTGRGLLQAWPAMRETFTEARAPETSFNQPIGADRHAAALGMPLDDVKRIAHGHAATINDVLLTVVAGGYRALLQRRGEGVRGVHLRTLVPVSLHSEAPGAARGNVDAAMIVPLPVGEDDSRRRLDTIAVDTAIRKRKARPTAGALFRFVTLQKAFVRLMPRQRFLNAYVANVPGPPSELYLGNARLLRVIPLVPLNSNVSIGVGAMSYAGRFEIAVVADRDLCPDLDAFVDGLRHSLAALEHEDADGDLRCVS